MPLGGPVTDKVLFEVLASRSQITKIYMTRYRKGAVKNGSLVYANTTYNPLFCAKYGGLHGNVVRISASNAKYLLASRRLKLSHKKYLKKRDEMLID